jgi:hypothetical protein
VATRLASAALGVGVSVLFFWLALKGTNFDALSAGWSTVSVGAAAVYVGSLFLIHLLRTARWGLMVRALDSSVSWANIVAMAFVGFAAVFLVPFRLGELARPLLLRQRSDLTIAAGLGTVAIERAVDGLVTVAIFFAASLMTGRAELQIYGLAAFAVFASASIAFFAMARWPAASEAFWRRLVGVLSDGLAEKVIGLLRGFVAGLASLPTWRLRLGYLVLTLLYWCINALGMWWLAQAMGLDIGVPAMFFTMALLVVGIMIPAGPGSIGTFHYFIKLGLVGFGVPGGVAMAYAVVVHLLQVAHMTVVALPFVFQAKIWGKTPARLDL